MYLHICDMCVCGVNRDSKAFPCHVADSHCTSTANTAYEQVHRYCKYWNVHTNWVMYLLVSHSTKLTVQIYLYLKPKIHITFVDSYDDQIEKYCAVSFTHYL